MESVHELYQKCVRERTPEFLYKEDLYPKAHRSEIDYSGYMNWKSCIITAIHVPIGVTRIHVYSSWPPLVFKWRESVDPIDNILDNAKTLPNHITPATHKRVVIYQPFIYIPQHKSLNILVYGGSNMYLECYRIGKKLQFLHHLPSTGSYSAYTVGDEYDFAVGGSLADIDSTFYQQYSPIKMNVLAPDAGLNADLNDLYETDGHIEELVEELEYTTIHRQDIY